MKWNKETTLSTTAIMHDFKLYEIIKDLLILYSLFIIIFISIYDYKFNIFTLPLLNHLLNLHFKNKLDALVTNLLNKYKYKSKTIQCLSESIKLFWFNRTDIIKIILFIKFLVFSPSHILIPFFVVILLLCCINYIKFNTRLGYKYPKIIHYINESLKIILLSLILYSGYLYIKDLQNNKNSNKTGGMSGCNNGPPKGPKRPRAKTDTVRKAYQEEDDRKRREKNYNGTYTTRKKLINEYKDWVKPYQEKDKEGTLTSSDNKLIDKKLVLVKEKLNQHLRFDEERFKEVICDYRFDEDDNFIYLVCKATGNAVYKAPK